VLDAGVLNAAGGLVIVKEAAPIWVPDILAEEGNEAKLRDGNLDLSPTLGGGASLEANPAGFNGNRR
jgi:hypothetical protein